MRSKDRRCAAPVFFALAIVTVTRYTEHPQGTPTKSQIGTTKLGIQLSRKSGEDERTNTATR
jgi:hypothetical protein